jgi:hypothetical protein
MLLHVKVQLQWIRTVEMRAKSVRRAKLDVSHELEDIITDINISFTEKYDEIEDEDKRDIFKKYIKLKDKVWEAYHSIFTCPLRLFRSTLTNFKLSSNCSK